MRALSLTQPWASLLANGAKRIETRSWGTPYRGWVAIHAAKGFPRDCKELCLQNPFLEALGNAGFGRISQLPLGAVIGFAHLHRVGRIGRRADGLRVEGPVIIHGNELPITDETELAFGDYTPGRWAWCFSNFAPLQEPIPAKGMLGLWEWMMPAGMRLPESVAAILGSATPEN